MAVVGDLVVRMDADTNPLAKATRKAVGFVRRFASSATSVLRGAGAIAFKAFVAAGTATLAAGLTAITASLREFVKSGAGLNKLSKQTGETASNLSELKFAAGQTGVEFDDVSGAIEEFNIRLGEAVREGTGPAAETMKKLGLSAKKLAKLTPVERIEKLATALKKVKNSAARGFAADELLGGDAFKLLPLLEQGGEGIRRLRGEARNRGLVIDNESARKAAEFGKQWKAMIMGVKQVLFDLGEVITDVFGMTSAKGGIRGFAKTFKEEWLPIIKSVLMLFRDQFLDAVAIVKRAWRAVFGEGGDAIEKIKSFLRNIDLFRKLMIAKFKLFGVNLVQLFKNIGRDGLEIFKLLGTGIINVYKNAFLQIIDNARRFRKALLKAIQGKGLKFQFKFNLLKGARDQFRDAGKLITKGFKDTSPEIEKILKDIRKRERDRLKKPGEDGAKPKPTPAPNAPNQLWSAGGVVKQTGSVEGALRGSSAFFQRLADIRGKRRGEELQKEANKLLKNIADNTDKPIDSVAAFQE